MKKLIAFIVFISCVGCNGSSLKKGSLSDLSKFHVFVSLSSFQKDIESEAFQQVVSSLKNMGKIHLEKESIDLTTFHSQIPILLLFLHPESKEFCSIRVIGDVETIPGHFKMGCCLWNFNLSSQEDQEYPFLENGHVVFKKGNLPNNTSKSIGDSFSVKWGIDELLQAFVDKYQKENPPSQKPTFYIHETFLSLKNE